MIALLRKRKDLCNEVCEAGRSIKVESQGVQLYTHMLVILSYMGGELRGEVIKCGELEK